MDYGQCPNAMKKYLLSILLVLFMVQSVAAQRYIEDINQAMQAGDMALIARYFDKIVDITIANESTTYSKSQAEMVLKDFFGKNAVNSFKLTNRGGDSANTYLIGRLNTKGGNYILYLFLKKKSKEDEAILQEIKIERQPG